jgi:ABC-2 type transport system ATP-binding protein
VRDVGLRRPTLDDVFLTLTGHHAAEAEEVERPRTREEAR